MLYAHFVGYISDIRYAHDKTPFVKCLAQLTSTGEEIEIRVFGENNLRDLNHYSLIRVKQAKVKQGFWKGHLFYNGTPIGTARKKFLKPLEFSIANGFNLSSLN
jgi:hypothetical protein